LGLLGVVVSQQIGEETNVGLSQGADESIKSAETTQATNNDANFDMGELTTEDLDELAQELDEDQEADQAFMEVVSGDPASDISAFCYLNPKAVARLSNVLDLNSVSSAIGTLKTPGTSVPRTNIKFSTQIGSHPRLAAALAGKGKPYTSLRGLCADLGRANTNLILLRAKKHLHELEDALNKEKSKIAAERANLEGDKKAFKAVLASEKAQIDLLKQQNKAEKLKLEHAQKKLENHRKALADAEAKVKVEQVKYEAAKKAAELFKKNLDTQRGLLAKEKEAHQKQLVDFKSGQDAFHKAQHAFQKAQRELTAEKAKHDNLKKGLEAEKAKLKEKREKLNAEKLALKSELAKAIAAKSAAEKKHLEASKQKLENEKVLHDIEKGKQTNKLSREKLKQQAAKLKLKAEEFQVAHVKFVAAQAKLAAKELAVKRDAEKLKEAQARRHHSLEKSKAEIKELQAKIRNENKKFSEAEVAHIKKIGEVRAHYHDKIAKVKAEAIASAKKVALEFSEQRKKQTQEAFHRGFTAGKASCHGVHHGPNVVPSSSPTTPAFTFAPQQQS